jgi:hypothetical protein
MNQAAATVLSSSSMDIPIVGPELRQVSNVRELPSPYTSNDVVCGFHNHLLFIGMLQHHGERRSG